MSLLPVLACGMAAGLGLFLVLREFVPSRPRLDVAIANLTPADPRRLRRDTPALQPPRGRQRLGALIQTRLGTVPGFTAPVKDLTLIAAVQRRGAAAEAQAVRGFYTDKVTAAGIGLVMPAAAGAVLAAAGLALPVVIPAGLALVLAAAFWFLPDVSVRAQAAQARTDFAYAVVSYLRLVAIRRLGSSGLVPSMEDAAQLSDAWMFQRIREELLLARWSKRPPWDALTALADRLDVPELREVAEITRQAGTSGANITGSLMARAASMRDRLISAEHVEAVKATTAMKAPVGALFSLFALALIYPAAMAILQ